MTSSLDFLRARQETPACHDLIHFNNAGAALMPTPVTEALYHYLRSEEQIGGYETEARYATELQSIYESAARLLNCQAEEIAFTESATRAWDFAFYSFPFKPGDKILTTYAEYGSNVVGYLHQAKRLGVQIVFVPNDEYGQIDVNALEQMIDNRVKLISITHIPTGGGLVNPAKAAGKIAKAAGVPYLLDACQSVGQMPIDVEEIGCDALCITGRKFLRGPRGTGLLYIRNSLLNSLEPPFLDQHAAELINPQEYRIRPDAKRYENWEQYCAGKYALGAAINYALDWGLDNIQQRIYALATILRQRLSAIEGVTLTDEGQEQCGIVTFISSALSPAMIKQGLAQHKINISTSKGSGSMVGYSHRGLTEVARVSVHYYNTEQEIDTLARVLKELISRASQ